MGLIALAIFTVMGVAMAQTLSAADRILLLQAKRFEGSYKLPSGETSVKVTDTTADFKVKSGTTDLAAAIAPKEGKPNRATLTLDGKTIDGKAGIEGKTLTFEFVDGKTKYVIKLVLSGRNEGDLSVKKDDTALVSGSFKRA